MLDKEDRVIVGVSGGADSICLLFMLMKLKEELNLDVLAVHVHHGLRGEDADADAEYVRRICDEWGVGLRTFREDVRKLAGQSGLSLEEAGRDIRREIFLKVRGELGSGNIVSFRKMTEKITADNGSKYPQIATVCTLNLPIEEK